MKRRRKRKRERFDALVCFGSRQAALGGELEERAQITARTKRRHNRIIIHHGRLREKERKNGFRAPTNELRWLERRFCKNDKPRGGAREQACWFSSRVRRPPAA